MILSRLDKYFENASYYKILLNLSFFILTRALTVTVSNTLDKNCIDDVTPFLVIFRE